MDAYLIEKLIVMVGSLATFGVALLRWMKDRSNQRRLEETRRKLIEVEEENRRMHEVSLEFQGERAAFRREIHERVTRIEENQK
jgi:hypothetical protein